MMLDARTRSAIRSALRLIWFRTVSHRVRKRARTGRGRYVCEACCALVDKVEVDHVIPCGPTPGSRKSKPDTTWDELINRMFCDTEHLQVLCVTCHRQKGKQ